MKITLFFWNNNHFVVSLRLEQHFVVIDRYSARSMKYHITIEEILARCVEIEAESKEEAIRKAADTYKKGEIVLDWNDLTDTKFSVCQNGSEP